MIRITDTVTHADGTTVVVRAVHIEMGGEDVTLRGDADQVLVTLQSAIDLCAATAPPSPGSNSR